MAGPTAEQHVALPCLKSAWLTLTFLHWPVPPAQVQALLPPGLVVDEWRGSAWVSLTPFEMADMRPLGWGPSPGAPGLPGRAAARALHALSSSPETNLRTYVRGPDGRDGLWFLSLAIAGRALAVTLRSVSGAPYHHGRLGLDRSRDAVTYTGAGPGDESSYHLVVRPGDPIEPTELDTWLTGRWRAYTSHLDRLLVFPVEHEPWPLLSARVEAAEQTVADAAGLSDLGAPHRVQFSAGVRRVRMGFPRLAHGAGPRPGG